MQISAVKAHANSQSFDGVRKIVHTMLPIDSKSLRKISLNIKDGKFTQTQKLEHGTLAYPEGVGRLTQWFNGDKLVGTLEEFSTGRYSGARVFKDGTSIDYTSAGDTVHTIVRKNGKILSHTTAIAYKENGKPNIMTKKQIDEMFQMTKELLENPELLKAKTAEAIRKLKAMGKGTN